ncbi:PGF-CTERM sorting domain-containing protein [Natrinema sp. S1CR25-10]|uniref:PGF-CTERM sorting domain-containing protein n=2 Tax=Natrinema salsiterrestre TaxID=2950540 RepID=A0A9Q4KZL5_9EURY|nr:PGF-CTERM sorting domain-containing protein [Natrinema salsiterrestre]
MSAAFAGGAAAAENAEFEDSDGNVASGFYEGQTVTITGLNDGDQYDIRYAEDFDNNGEAENDRFEDEFTADGSTHELDTTGYETGYYYISGPNDAGESDENRSFELRSMEFRTAGFADDTVDNDENATFELDTNRGTYDLNVSADGLDEDNLDSIFGEDFNTAMYDEEEEVLTLQNVEDGEFNANFTDIDTGEYNFSIESNDTSAETNASIEVTEGQAGGIEFSSSDVIETRTNTAVIGVDLTDTDTGYLKVGTIDEAGYEATLKVTDDDSNEDETGTVLVQMNTIAAAMDGNAATVDSSGAFTTADTDDSVEVVAIDGNDDLNSLGTGDYPLSVSSDWEDGSPSVYDDNEQDTSYLTLEQREALGSDAVTAHTAPADSLSDIQNFDPDDQTIAGLIEDENISETDTVAQNDGLLVSVDSDSLHAFFADDDAETFEEAGLNTSAFNLTISGEDSGPNANPPEWTTTGNDTVTDNYIGDNVEIVESNQSTGTMLFHINYVGIQSDYDNADLNVTDNISTDETYDVSLNVDQDWEYASDEAQDNEEDEVSTDTVTLEDREFDLDSSNEELPASATATVSGETNVAPGTEVTDRLRSSGNFTQSESAYVADDGTFEIAHDLSEYSADIPYSLNAEEDGGASDSLNGKTIGGEELQSLTYDVTPDPAEPVVGDDVTGTIAVENPNDEGAVSEDVEFVFDGETLYNDTVELEGGASTSVDATLLEDAEAGDYEWELIVDGETEESGTLTVAEESDDSGSDDSGSDDSGSDDSGSDDSGSDDSGSDDSGSSDGTPGFGVGVALVALLGAAMLALRRQN